jgi:hypothetical protein
MARTIAEIQAEIIAQKEADSTLSGLSSGSATAIWRLWTYIVAVAIHTLESLYDVFRAEVLEDVSRLRPHTPRWYQEKALAFQYGADLPEGSDEYDNTGVDVDTVEDQQIVAQAAVVEESGSLVIKIAKEVGSQLEKLDAAEVTSFEEYINEVKDAGVDVEVRSFDGDKLEIEIDIYYDPLVLNSSGGRIDGTNNTPVKDAITEFLRDLPFDGLFIKSKLVDKLQAVEGVYVPQIRICQAAKFDSSAFTTIDIQYAPYAGFLRIYNQGDLVLNYTSQSDV